MNAPKPRTPSQQKAKAKDAHPQIELDGPSRSRRPEPRTEGKCLAHRLIRGEKTICDLDVGHDGDHEGDGTSWRPRSGDASDIAAAGEES